MKRLNQQYFLAISFCLFLIMGCHKDQENNKIIYTLPINTNVVVTPAFAAQQFLLLKRSAAETIVPIINRIGLTGQSFSELTGPNGSSQYTFNKSESHYGAATFTIQFRDSSNAIIDPIQTQSSTATLKSVLISVSGNSNLFSYSESLTMTLDTAGQADSTKRLTGSSNFTGSTYNITFTISAGIVGSFDALTSGTFEGTGNGGPSNSATSISLSIATNQDANGSISWEGDSGGLHLEANGSGFVSTNQYLIPIQ